MHCVKYAKKRTFYDAYFPVFDAALIRENTATILSIYGKIRLRFCLYKENRGERKPSFRYILRKDFEEMKVFY